MQNNNHFIYALRREKPNRNKAKFSVVKGSILVHAHCFDPATFSTTLSVLAVLRGLMREVPCRNAGSMLGVPASCHIRLTSSQMGCALTFSLQFVILIG